jgi:hypothetical protein
MVENTEEWQGRMNMYVICVRECYPYMTKAEVWKMIESKAEERYYGTMSYNEATLKIAQKLCGETYTPWDEEVEAIIGDIQKIQPDITREMAHHWIKSRSKELMEKDSILMTEGAMVLAAIELRPAFYRKTPTGYSVYSV